MMMKDLLRILIVEDSEDDALLTLHQIQKSGYAVDYERVESAETMKAALKGKKWDIILSDYRMPNFNGLEALKILKETGIDLPFIIISGTIGEDLAVEAMRSGANDYLMKDNLKRLVPAIERELRDMVRRSANKQNEERMILMNFALNHVHEGASLIDENACFRYVNEETCRVLGYTRAELLGMTVFDIDPDLPPEHWRDHWNALKAEGSLIFEAHYRAKDGRIFPVEINSNHFEYDNQPYHLTLVRDITERKRSEEALHSLNRELQAISNCNQILIRAEDEQNLLNDICRTICDKAGYQLVWVGYAENDAAKTIRPMAWAGIDSGYIAKAKLSWADDSERGQGPAGIAVRSGEKIYCQDIVTDPRMRLWRENALQRGYRSVIALPLKDENAAVFGVLLIYSSEPNAITQDEVRLLEELAGDLSFGINVIRTRIQRKQAEQQIELLSYSLDHVREGAFLTDLQNRVVYVNQEACRSLEYERDELLGMTVTDFNPDTTEEQLTGFVADAQDGSMSFETRHRTRSGRIFPVEITATRIDYGETQFGLAMVRDITERKRAERERASHLDFFINMDRINRVIQGATDLEQMMGNVLDTVLSTLDCDRAYLMYPCDPDSQTWFSPMERHKPEYTGVLELNCEIPMDPQVAETFRILLASDGPVTFGPSSQHVLPKDVSKRFKIKSIMGIAIYPKTGSPWQFGVHQCSHARVWTAEEKKLLQEIGRRLADGLTILLAYRDLTESEERFRILFENSPVSIWEEDFSAVKSIFDDLRQQGVSDIEAWFDRHPETVLHCAESAKIVDVNKAALALHGATTKEELMAGLVNTFTPESFEIFRQELVCLWNGDTEMVENAVVKTLSGDPRYATVYFSVCPGCEQTLSKVLVSLIDITERKRVEAEMVRLKHYLANIINSMPSVLVGMDQSGIVTQWNRQAEEMSGISTTEAVGRPITQLGPDLSPWIDTMRKEVDRHRPASKEKLLIEKEGERRFYNLMVYPLLTNGVEGAVLRIEDVTEQARIQELMVQTEKMMSLGGLAAGMAHEINNPLGIIIQAAQNIERRVLTDLPANREAAEEIGISLAGMKAYFEKRQIPEFIGSIREASARASRIIANILRFSRSAETTLQPGSLADIMDQALKLAASDYDLKKKFDFRNIEIIRDYAPEMPEIPMSSVEMEQVMLNLLKNAAQAMIENPSDRKPKITLRLRREERYAVLEVEDNGPGMAEEIRRRVFEPFFTTKEPGIGTGLGLSVSYMIVTQNHKGLMEVASTPGRGACFTVRLPLPEEGIHE